MVNTIVLNTSLLMCTQFLEVDTFEVKGIMRELRKQKCTGQVYACLKHETIQKCLTKQLEK